MRARFWLALVVGPMILACGGLPKLPGADGEEAAPSQASPHPSVTALDEAIDVLNTRLDAAEAANPAALDAGRITAARAKIAAAHAALDPAVKQVTEKAPTP